MKLLIHIVTGGRVSLLRDCCISVARFLPDDARVNVIVNGPSGETVRFLKSFNHPAFQWEVIPKEPRPLARNRAFDVPGFDLIYFLDDDVVVSAPIFHRARLLFELDPGLVVLGGPNLTIPGSTWEERLFGSIMTSKFAAPMVNRRYGSEGQGEFSANEHSLILCNLALRANGIPTWLRLQGHLQSNEENLFLFECRRLRLGCRFSSALGVYHRRRKDLVSFTRQVFSYGFGRAQQTFAAPRSCHPAFLVPGLTCLLLFALLLIPAGRPVALTLLMLHVGLSLLGAFRSPDVRELGTSGLLLSPPLTLLIHFAYGFGFWSGLSHSIRRPRLEAREPSVK